MTEEEALLWQSIDALRTAITDLRDGQTRFMSSIFDQVNELKNKVYTLEAQVLTLEQRVRYLERP